MKRFLLFAGSSYYPDGGWGDFIGHYDTEEEIKIEETFYPLRERSSYSAGPRGDKAFAAQPVHEGWSVNGEKCDWYHVIDTETIN